MRPSRTALSVVAAAGAAALGGAVVALPASANGEGGHHHFRTIHGTVVSDDGTTLVLTNRSGTHDVLVNRATKYSETGDPNPVTTASPGQFVSVKVIDMVAAPDSSSTSSTSSTPSSGPTSSSSASPTLDPVAGRVTILLQSISGVVTNITGTTVTLTRDEDHSRTVDVSGADIYQRTRAADGTWTTTPTTLAVNDLVTAFGTKDKMTPTTFHAQFVKVRGMATPDDDNDQATTSSTSSTTTTTSSNTLKPGVMSPSVGDHDEAATHDDDNDRHSAVPSATWVKGTVVSASNGSIVIKKFDGSQVTVTTTETTKYRTDDGDGSGSNSSSSAPASFSGIAPNDHIAAEVTPSGGALDAVVVDYAAPPTQSDGDHSGSWSGDHSSSSPSGSSRSFDDHHSDDRDGGSGGSFGGGGSDGGGPSGRH
jgi:hypothetical protein